MNLWKQTRQFECPRCEAKYVHDKGYMHEVFLCPNRVRTAQGNAAGPLLNRAARVGGGDELVSGALALKNNCCAITQIKEDCDEN